LVECWDDFLLRAQIVVLIAKCPEWAVIESGQLKRAELFSPLKNLSLALG
jgi:hypothetical protein